VRTSAPSITLRAHNGDEKTAGKGLPSGAESPGDQDKKHLQSGVFRVGRHPWRRDADLRQRGLVADKPAHIRLPVCRG
jgi:hypothetical protein